jgi:uncharacterized repeat protein (TIGR01451 family)
MLTNWQAINQGLTQQGVLSLAYANGRLYAGTARGVFVRQDSGVSWQLIGLADRSVSSLLITADTLWAGTDQGVFRTALITPPSWSAVGALAQVVYSMAFDGNQRLYMGTRDTGVYRFEAGAWQLFSTGLTPQRIYALRPRGASQLSLLAGTENGVWINEIQPPPTLTPTVTDTPAATATPTITPTPTPGIKTIRLHNDPQRELAGDDTVIYTIDLENGPFALTKVMVSNALPNEMMLVTDSMTGPADWVPSVKDRTIQWERSTLPEGATAQFAYRAVRYTPTSTPTPTLVATEPLTPTSTATATGTSGVPSTPTPVASPVDTVTETPTSVSTNLAITKIGPAEVAIGQDIRYHLIVTNPFTRPLTGMTIVDVIPVGAEVVDFGGGAMTMPPSAMLQWQVPVLNAQSTVTRTFAIRLPISRRLVVNDLYFVDVIENGVLRLRAVGKDPVVTTIMGGTLEPLQVTLFPATLPLTATTPITNNGAIVTWEYPGFDGQLVSNGVRNPPWRLYMPFIPR